MSKDRMLFLTLLSLVVFWSVTAVGGMVVDNVWVRTYNGPGNSEDVPCAIEVDNSGNVYITGYSTGNGTFSDYATIKYYPDGDTAWVRRYNGPADTSDIAFAMAIDDLGNVYVTGSSHGSGSKSDYLTIKYQSSGDTAWVRRYNGPSNGNDVAYALALDGSGNVYVTGFSSNSGMGKDYATLKYDQNGNQIWVKNYNGPGNDADWANGIAVDPWGNIYVTGVSRGEGTYYDYLTLKYDPDGDTLWVRRYDGPESGDNYANAIALDGSGNVYVTGWCYSSSTLYQYATVKYDSNGNQGWAKTFAAEQTITPGATALDIEADNFGNVWVTGWDRRSETLFDYATVKYDDEGNQLCGTFYHSWLDGCDGANALTIDNQGNAYVTGWSDDLDLTADDFATVKYDQDGNQLWLARYNGPSDSWDNAKAITVDDSNYVYVTGQSVGTSSANDYVTIKYVQLDALRGDVNSDEEINLSDVIYLANYLLKSGSSPAIQLSGDVNCDWEINMSDVIYLANYLLKGGPPPC